MTSFPATMEVMMDWIWCALVLLMVTLSTFPSPDIGQDLSYLTQQMFILQPTHTSADLLPRYNICKLLSLILISFPVSETTIKNYLVTYPSSASNIMAIVHGLILHSASCTCLNQLPRAGDKCNAHRQCRAKFPPSYMHQRQEEEEEQLQQQTVANFWLYTTNDALKCLT